MKVRFNVSIASSLWGSAAPGEIKDIPDDEALAQIKAGHAEPVEPTMETADKKTAKTTRKKGAGPKED